MPAHEVRSHYERHPYPRYPLLSSVRRCDTYALNLQALWARFNGVFPQACEGRILIAGSGSFAPYPMSVANPEAQVTSLDLSGANLRRARLHCLLHGRRNLSFVQGDLLDPAIAPGPFHFIDSFGVLHHLDDPGAGLRALEKRLASGGILRVMLYGRYARREAESVRRAVRLLGIRDVAALKSLISKAKPGSRVRGYLDASWEARTDSGLADLFLNPQVRTYRIDELLDMIGQTGLQPLLFAHGGALADPEAEIERLRELDRQRETPTNIICYLGLGTCGPAGSLAGNVLLRLNPCLTGAISPLNLRAVRLSPRLGRDNPLLDRSARVFLRRFRVPISVESLTDGDRERAGRFWDALFLLTFNTQ
jgi:SAM-dependent methyltransferase